MIDARLPAHYDPATIDSARHAPWVIAHLLEEGDTEDLRWLIGHYGLRRLRRWLADRGRRQLSVRSEAFWGLVLGVDVGGEPDDEATEREALWPR